MLEETNSSRYGYMIFLDNEPSNPGRICKQHTFGWQIRQARATFIPLYYTITYANKHSTTLHHLGFQMPTA